MMIWKPMPLAVVLAIYAVFEWVLPRFFGRAKTVTAPITAPVVEKIKEVVKPKFPFPSTAIPGEQAIDTFEAARLRGERGTVLFGWGRDQIPNLAQAMSYRKETPEQILTNAAANPEPFPARSRPKQPAQWPAAGPVKNERHPFLVSVHPSGFKPEVLLVTTPASDDAEIFAYLKFGGWNGCPGPHIHVAVMRRWQRDYGAEFVAFSHDALDVRVRRRPQTQAEALALARAHLKYCPSNDTTIAEYAAELMETDWWHF
jgi:hypothetical protein